MNIIFKPDNKIINIDKSESILDLAKRAGININAYCSGKGICGKCKIKIISGAVSELTNYEKNVLSEYEINNSFRLACKTYPLNLNENIIVDVLSFENKDLIRKKNINIVPKNLMLDTGISKKCIQIKKNLKSSNKSYINNICSILGISNFNVNISVLKSLESIFNSEDENNIITVVFQNDNIISIEQNNTSDFIYGIAFDIGTTTVVGMLWDLKSGILIDTESATNSQEIYGNDIISRIQFACHSEKNLSDIQYNIIECINNIIYKILLKNNIEKKFVYYITIVGNTTMSHLLLGINPLTLSKKPFLPIFSFSGEFSSNSIGLNINKSGLVYVMPNIAGHVGSDITACMLYTDIFSMNGISIIVDIGTNGEIVAAFNGTAFVCSTAAGPAFEGAGIYQGMRAYNGAIECVNISDENVIIKTIGDCKALGICGSGIIDAIAELISIGIVDKTGRMIEKEEALKNGINKKLCDRIIETRQGTSFVLEYLDEYNIVITQKDIRAIQLAKGAILAGIKTLINIIGVSENSIDRILIAGAFGNYIKKESAIKIKLFPNIDINKIHFIGNAAGSGASMALLSRNERRKAENWAKITNHVELSENLYFQDEFINSMEF